MPLQWTSGRRRSSSGPHREVAEEHDVVHAPQRVHQFGALGLADDRPIGALELPHRRVVVDRDDEHVGFLRGALQVPEMPDVQQVEHAVGQRDRLARGPVLRDAREQDVERDDHRSPSRAARSSSRDAVAVPRFITTMPPA